LSTCPRPAHEWAQRPGFDALPGRPARAKNGQRRAAQKNNFLPTACPPLPTNFSPSVTGKRRTFYKLFLLSAIFLLFFCSFWPFSNGLFFLLVSAEAGGTQGSPQMAAQKPQVRRRGVTPEAEQRRIAPSTGLAAKRWSGDETPTTA
jgi:hypothetical protein